MATNKECPRCGGAFDYRPRHHMGPGYGCTGCDAYFSVWYIEDVGWPAAIETIRRRERVFRVPLYRYMTPIAED